MRQRGDIENQGVAEAKAARAATLAKLNKERRQKRLKDAQELNKCLGSGMDLLTPKQVWQITEAATAASNKPMDALRSFGERLRNLREENPHTIETDLRDPDQESSGRERVLSEWRLSQRRREKCCAFQKRAGRPTRISRDPLPAECCG